MRAPIQQNDYFAVFRSVVIPATGRRLKCVNNDTEPSIASPTMRVIFFFV